MSRAASFGNKYKCEYMIMIEEDIWLQRPFTADDRPKGDTGGKSMSKSKFEIDEGGFKGLFICTVGI